MQRRTSLTRHGATGRRRGCTRTQSWAWTTCRPSPPAQTTTVRECWLVIASHAADDAVPFMLEGVVAVDVLAVVAGVILEDLQLDDIVFD